MDSNTVRKQFWKTGSRAALADTCSHEPCWRHPASPGWLTALFCLLFWHQELEPDSGCRLCVIRGQENPNHGPSHRANNRRTAIAIGWIRLGHLYGVIPLVRSNGDNPA